MGIYNRDYMRDSSRSFMGPGWTVVGWLIAANVAVFLLQHLVLDQKLPAGGFDLDNFTNGKFYTLLTSLFVHAGLLHLAFNMIMLFFAGRLVLAQVGTRHFLLIYLLGGIAGTLLETGVRYFQGIQVHQIGASGAVMAIVCTLGVLIPWQRISLMLFFVIPVNMTIRTMVLVLIGLDLTLGLLGMVNPSVDSFLGSKVAHFAHLGGAFFGLLYGWRFLNPKRFRASLRQRKLKLLPPPEEVDEEAELQPVSFADTERNETRGRESRAKQPAARSGPSQVDAILDKMLAEGPKSLTEAERKILEEESRRLADKRKG